MGWGGDWWQRGGTKVSETGAAQGLVGHGNPKTAFLSYKSDTIKLILLKCMMVFGTLTKE